MNYNSLYKEYIDTESRIAKTQGYKKAIVTLKKGQSIDITTGI